jgi:hypothetical protein
MGVGWDGLGYCGRIVVVVYMFACEDLVMAQLVGSDQAASGNTTNGYLEHDAGNVKLFAAIVLVVISKQG